MSQRMTKINECMNRMVDSNTKTDKLMKENIIS